MSFTAIAAVSKEVSLMTQDVLQTIADQGIEPSVLSYGPIIDACVIPRDFFSGSAGM